MLASAPESYVDATGVLATSWLLLVLPLIGAAVLLLAGKRADKWGHFLGCATVGVGFVLGLICFFVLRGESERAVTLHLFDWIAVGDFRVERACCTTRCQRCSCC